MTPAAHQLLRALYLHALAPSTANQDAVRAAGAALDTETARALNAPRSPAPVDTVVAEVRADLLARSDGGIAKYGVTLDRTDLGLGGWMRHIYEELLDGALYAKRAMRELANAAPVEPPHAATPFLATLTPEPAEAVLGRAGEVLAEPRSDLASRAWQGALGKLVRETPSGEALAGSLPVYVLAGTGRHPYGDDAWHMETDGVARLFPSKEAAQRWLAAMGRAPV